MRCFVLAVAAALVVCAAAAPTEDAAKIPLSQVISDAQKNITQLASDIRTQLNLPDQEQVITAIKDQSNHLVSNVQSYIETVSKEAKDKTPEFQKLWSDVKSNLDKVVTDINSKIPNAKESAEQLQKQFNDAVQTIVKESNTIAEAVQKNTGSVKTEFASLTKKFLDIALKASDGLNDQLKKASEQVSAAAAA